MGQSVTNILQTCLIFLVVVEKKNEFVIVGGNNKKKETTPNRSTFANAIHFINFILRELSCGCPSSWKKTELRTVEAVFSSTYLMQYCFLAA